MEKIIASILLKEQEADQLIKDTNKKAFDIIQNSREEASKIIQDAQEKAGKKGNEFIEASTAVATSESELLMKSFDGMVKEIKNKAQKNTEKALEFIFRKIT